MAKRFRYPLLFGVIAVLVIAAGVLVALPWLVSTDLVRNALEDEMSDFIGRQVTLDGDVDLTLFPSPTVALANVSIPSDTEGSPPLVVIESISADIAPLTLLARNPDFTSFKLGRPRLNLSIDSAGKINWRDAFGRIDQAVTIAKRSIENPGAEDADEAAVPNNKMLSPDFPRRLGRITFENGSISITGTTTGFTEEATAVTGAIDWQSIDGSLTSSMSGVWRGLPVKMEISAEQPLALLAGKTSQTSLKIEGDPGLITYDGVLGLYDSLFADGSLTLSTASMSALLDWVKADIGPGRAIGALSLAGPVKVANRRARFETASISLDGNEGTGVLEIGFDNDMPPLVAGTLDFETLDLARFVGAFLQLPGDIFSSNTELELDFISQLRADLRLSAQTAQLGFTRLENLAATAQINDQAAIFDIGDATVYGGNLQGRLQLSNHEDAKKSFQISGAAQDIDTALMAGDVTTPDTIPIGIANATLNVHAPLGTWRQITRLAHGEVNLQMQDGITRGFGVSALLTSENTNQFFTVASENNADERFNTLAFKGALADGVMTISDSNITYDAGRVELEGVAPYRSGGIALTATAIPVDGSEEAEERRFFIGGSWDRAFATPLLPGNPAIE